LFAINSDKFQEEKEKKEDIKDEMNTGERKRQKDK
jgi:hypothetical protein